MKFWFSVIGICLLLGRLSNAGAQPAALTLDDAIHTALAKSPRLAAARGSIEATEGLAEQERAWPNPALFYSAEEVPREGSISDGKNILGVSQTIPFPLKKVYEGRAGRSAVEAARNDYGVSALSLERDVKIAFYRAIAAKQSVAIARELTETARGFAGAARLTVDSGGAPLQEALRAEIELERARADSIAHEREWELAREDLFILIGEAPRDADIVGDLPADTALATMRGPARPSAAMDATGSANTTGSARDRGDAHPLLEAAAARVDAADHALRRAKVEPLPDFDLSFGAGRDEADVDIIELEAAVSIPLFNFGGGMRREKRAELEIARANLAASQRNLEAGRSAARKTFRAAAEQASAYHDRILPRAEQALDLVRRGFEAGKFGFIDVLDTQRTLSEARLAYVETLLALNSARAEWEALDATSPPSTPKE